MHSHSVSPHQDGAGVGELIHSPLQAVSQILLTKPASIYTFYSRNHQNHYSLRSILDNGDGERIKEAIVAAGGRTRDRLDLLNICNRERVTLAEQGAQHGSLGMGMDAGTRSTLREGGHEQGRAGRGIEARGRAQVVFRGIVHDKHVGGLETLLLHTRGRNVDVVVVGGVGAD